MINVGGGGGGGGDKYRPPPPPPARIRFNWPPDHKAVIHIPVILIR